MGAGQVAAADLDDFVAEIDRRGGIASSEAVGWAADFEVDFETPVDTTVDGFSTAYTTMQQALYRELSGRDINQDANEWTAVAHDEVVDAANPYGSRDVDRIAHHARAVLTAIVVSELPTAARVLDLGCGWGLSTELFAFCGAEVHAVDVNPDFTDLVSERAGPRGLDVTTHVARFDTFDTDERFDLVFFYESLHHAIEPWSVIERAARWLVPEGKITLAGEPVQDRWWPQWGLRLDAESVYCIRKFGWFENGWSAAFLTECFRRAGLELTLLDGIGHRHTPIGVAVRPGLHADPPTAHWAVPPPPPAPPPLSVWARAARRLGLQGGP